MRFYVFASAETKPDFVSRRIMKQIRAPYSHVGIIVELHGDQVIHHAVEKGVCTADLAEFMKTHVLVHKIDVTALLAAPTCCALTGLEAEHGLRYGLMQYLGFAFPILKPLVRNGIGQRVCSEYVAAWVEKYLNIDLWGDLDFVCPRQVIEGLLPLVEQES